jgi:uncharacterized membrane protein
MNDHEISRRSFIKTAATGTAIGTAGVLGGGLAQAASTPEKAKNQLKVAGYGVRIKS